MEGIHNLMINVIILLIPFLIIRWHGQMDCRMNRNHRNLVGLINCMGIILCMSFPFHVLPGYIFDLRTIPLLIGIFYGGAFWGAATALVLYAFRLYLGGDGLWNVWIVYTTITVLAFLMVPTYQGMSSRMKRLTSTGLALGTSLLMLLNTYFREGLPQSEQLSLWFYFIAHGIVTFALIHLIEGSPLFLKAWREEEVRPIAFAGKLQKNE